MKKSSPTYQHVEVNLAVLYYRKMCVFLYILVHVSTWKVEMDDRQYLNKNTLLAKIKIIINIIRLLNTNYGVRI